MSLTDDQKRRIGESYGNAINTCFLAIAKLDGVPVETVVDLWIQEYLMASIERDAWDERRGG